MSNTPDEQPPADSIPQTLGKATVDADLDLAIRVGGTVESQSRQGERYSGNEDVIYVTNPGIFGRLFPHTVEHGKRAGKYTRWRESSFRTYVTLFVVIALVVAAIALVPICMYWVIGRSLGPVEELRRVVDSPPAESLEKELGKINAAIAKGDAQIRSGDSLNLRDVVLALNSKAATVHLLRQDRQKAVAAYERAIQHMDHIIATDPNWVPTHRFNFKETPYKGASPLKVRRAELLLWLAFAQIASSNITTESGKVAEIRSTLGRARTDLELAPDDGLRKQVAYQNLSASYWWLGDYSDAIKSLDDLLKSMGEPDGPENLSPVECEVHFMTSAMKCAIFSEMGNIDAGLAIVDRVDRFGAKLPGPHHGIVGTLFLIASANATSQQQQIQLLKRARERFGLHVCSSCLFGDACAASRLGQLEHDPIRKAALFDEAKASIRRSISDLSREPIKLDVVAAREMPFLRPIIDDPALQSIFTQEWKPNSAAEVLPMVELWHEIPPVVWAKFPYHSKGVVKDDAGEAFPARAVPKGKSD